MINKDKLNEVHEHIKNHVTPYIVLLLLYGSGITVIWSTYKSLNDEKLEIEKQRYFMRAEIEKEKHSLEIENINIRLKEQNLSEREKEIERQESKLKKVLSENAELKTKYTKTDQKVSAENKVKNLMSEFSSLGVNLKNPDWCDKEYTKRYYKAESIIEEIKTLTDRYKLDKEYYWFASRNSHGVFLSRDGVCEKNNANKSLQPTPKSGAAEL